MAGGAEANGNGVGADVASADVTTAYCPNCGSPAPRRYCPDCGQEQGPLRPTVREILRDFAEEHLGWDSKIMRSIGLLMARPGALTLEYIAGRRVRYLRPLRLYLVSSVLCFLAVAAAARLTEDAPAETPPAGDRTVTVAPVRIDAGTAANGGSAGAAATAGTSAQGSWLARRYSAQKRKISALPKEQRREAVTATAFEQSPKAILLLVPAMALLLRLLYARSSVRYAQHLVFALHAQSAVFLLVLLTAALVLLAEQLSPVRKLTIVPPICAAVHVFLAMRRVYGQHPLKTAVKFVALGLSYTFLLLIATLLLAGMAVILF